MPKKNRTRPTWKEPSCSRRDQAKLDSDQAILERNKAIHDRDLLMAEREQEQRLQESVANCDQIKSEIERLQRRQQAVASGKEKRRTTTEPAVAISRPEPRIELDEGPRASGCFKFDRVAQVHMNLGLEAWTIPEPVPSLRNLESSPVRPLMEISLSGLTLSSTSGSQTGSCERGCSQGLARRNLSQALPDGLDSGATRKEGCLPRRFLGWKFHPVQDTRECSPLDYRGQPDTSVDANPGALAGGNLEFFWCCNTPDVGVARDGKHVHGHIDAGNP